MIRFSLPHLLVGLTMLLVAIVTMAITPDEKAANSLPVVDLESMIPSTFGEWKEQPGLLPVSAQLLTPETVAGRIYDQVLMRTYTNGQNDRIMLVIAYGSDQSDNLSVHNPEVCYAAQGFQVNEPHAGILVVGNRQIPIKRLLAVNGLRYEPITYWITVGNQVVVNGMDRKIAQLKYSLTGKIPDGMLIRVSTLSQDEQSAYSLHQEFINEMVKLLPNQHQDRLVGARTL